MNLIVWLVVGGIVGWLASIIMKRDAQQGIILNVIVGIVGALLAGWLISPLVGVGSINDGLSVGSFLVSLVGAIVLLAIHARSHAGLSPSTRRNPEDRALARSSYLRGRFGPGAECRPCTASSASIHPAAASGNASA